MTQVLFGVITGLVILGIIWISIKYSEPNKVRDEIIIPPIKSTVEGDPFQYIGHNVLVTTSAWFYGKDGKQYRAIYGKLRGVFAAKDLFGFTPNASHANWLLEIGDMVVMGCQVLYCIKCDDPYVGDTEDWSNVNGDYKSFARPTSIYKS
jgi:hypothetical protein